MNESDGRIEKQLEELESWVGTSVGDAYSAALEVEMPAGHSPAWLDILKDHGIHPSSEEERVRVVSSSGMFRGAPADELFAVLDAIQKTAEKSFDRIDLPDDDALGRRRDRLQGAIGRLRDETLRAYRRLVMPKRSMFGASLKSARAKKGQVSAQGSAGEVTIMRCEKCGAPRLSNTVFVCEYCDTPYAG